MHISDLIVAATNLVSAVRTPLGLAALLVLLVGWIVYRLFSRGHTSMPARVGIFVVATIFSILLFILAVMRVSPVERFVVPLPMADQKLIVASVIAPDPVPAGFGFPETSCFSAPAGFTLIVISEDAPFDTHGGSPKCGENPQGHCMAGGVRCFNIFLREGCLVSTAWLRYEKEQRSQKGLPDVTPREICDPNG